MIVTIDGPAGAGKSSAAKRLPRRLGFEFLDTGAMYRAVTLAGLRVGIDRANQAALAQLLDGIASRNAAGICLLNGEDVTGLIRTAEVTAASARIADSPVVRRRLVEMQRQIATGRNMVCEGRDQGTLVFPDAACKFFLVADPAERARRRQGKWRPRAKTFPWMKCCMPSRPATSGTPAATWDDGPRRQRRAFGYHPPFAG